MRNNDNGSCFLYDEMTREYEKRRNHLILRYIDLDMALALALGQS